MKRIPTAALLLMILILCAACKAPDEPVKVSVTVDPTLPTPIPTATPVPTAEPTPVASPQLTASQSTEEPLPTGDIFIPDELPDFIEMSYEQIDYSQGKSTIRLPVANTSSKVAKGSLVFDVYFNNEIAPKYTLEARIEDRDEKIIYPGETVLLIATSSTDLRDCMIRVRPDPIDPIKLVD